jgi:hypothetical protein
MISQTFKFFSIVSMIGFRNIFIDGNSLQINLNEFQKLNNNWIEDNE